MGSVVRAPRAGADGATQTRIDPRAYAGELRHAGELVGAAPGAVMLDFGGVLATSTVSLRGASADQVQVVFDGVALNALAGGGFDLSQIPAALLDSVDVRRGSEGARIGAGAMGGAVLLQPASRSRALLTAGSLGTYGASASLSREWMASTGLWRTLVAVDGRRSAGNFVFHRDPTPEIPDNDPLERLRRENNAAAMGSVLMRAEHRAGTDQSLHALVMLSGSRRGLPGSIYSPTPDMRQEEKGGLLNLRWRTPVTAVAVAEVPLMLRGGLLEGAGGLGDHGGLQRAGEITARPGVEWVLGGQLLRVSTSAGVELFEGEQHGSRSRLRGGLGLEWLRPHGRWTSSASLRAERWGADGAILPRVGGSVRMSPGWTVAANLGAGFRPPSFGELYFAAGPVLANPDLLPERSWSGDLSLRFARGPLSVAASAFGALYRDVIVYELYPGFRAKPFNIGRASVAGGELEGRWRVKEGRLAGLGATLSLTELLAINRVEGHNTYGKLLPYRPRRRLVTRADYRRERLRGALELQATSAAFVNRANTRTAPAFFDLRGNVGVLLGGGLWFSAEVRNALDVTDRMAIDGFPLPGRVVLAHLSWEPNERED